ncbi:anti-sigma factor antagonist [Nostoc sp. DSM 114167]|jgi:anti-anti-sigma factor|uniref:anti-sigma factor antagonist n=1 Tax=Nostoc sp. DSM 114167 TaxID=3439050 RepID=UPI0040466757
MSLSVTLEISNDVAKITLSGELDAMTAPIFKTEVEKAAVEHPKHLVLLMQDLEYMASAGLRVLIFAKQTIDANANIYIVAPQEMVLETLKKTGLDQSLLVVDEYDTESLQKLN